MPGFGLTEQAEKEHIMVKASPKRSNNSMGPDFTVITLDGEEVRPKDTMFIVWNPDGVAVAAFPSDTTTRADLARAARIHWSGSTEAILALNKGYRLTHVTFRRFLAEIAPKMQPES